MPPEPPLRTPEQVAARAGLSRKTIYRAIERGDLAAYRLCGRLRIKPEDEDAWIDSNRLTGDPAAVAPPPADQRAALATHGLRQLLREAENGTGLDGAGS